MRIPGIKDFIYEEFYPKKTFDTLIKDINTFIWMINQLDPKIPILVQFMRTRFKKAITINDWYFNKSAKFSFTCSGFRPSACKIGARFSRHKLGLCADVKVLGMSAHEVQKDIELHFDTYKRYGLTAIEANTPTWTHVSVENTTWREQDTLWRINYEPSRL